MDKVQNVFTTEIKFRQGVRREGRCDNRCRRAGYAEYKRVDKRFTHIKRFGDEGVIAPPNPLWQ